MANVKISAIPTTVAPASLTTSDFVPISRAGSTNAKVDLSLLGAFTRLQGLTPYTTRALAVSGAVDSAASIQTQLDTLSTAGGGIAYLPAGFYFMTAYISVPSNVRFIGAGKA
jgi:polygalacturonase